MEGQFKTQRQAPLRIGGWPDDEAGETRWAIEIPGGLSYLATGDPAAEVPGLDRVRTERLAECGNDAFGVSDHGGIRDGAAVGVGIVLVLRSCDIASAMSSGGGCLWALVLAAPLGFVGLEAGWFVTEVGRQPWIIQRRDADVGRSDSGGWREPDVLCVFGVCMCCLGVTVVVLLRRIAASPVEDEVALWMSRSSCGSIWRRWRPFAASWPMRSWAGRILAAACGICSPRASGGNSSDWRFSGRWARCGRRTMSG